MKNCFVIVNEKTGRMLENSATLPIYHLRGVAKRVAERFPGYIVKPIDLEQLKSLFYGK